MSALFTAILPATESKLGRAEYLAIGKHPNADAALACAEHTYGAGRGVTVREEPPGLTGGFLRQDTWGNTFLG